MLVTKIPSVVVNLFFFFLVINKRGNLKNHPRVTFLL